MKCVVCGKEIKESMYQGDTICSHRCFTKNYWNNKLNNAIVINGKCYHVGEENNSKYFRGMGGAKYTIKKKDGTIIHTTNLWQNGIIPEEFYTEDNAEFIW